MRKKDLGYFLMGVSMFLCSCVDDTYDLNKEVMMDMKIEGNRIALPLGSLRPIVLDSILDVSSIPVLESDSVTRTYSLSFNDSIVSRVAQKDLGVLKEVSKLSSDIDPIGIDLQEIRFNFPAFKLSDSMSFQNVKLSDVSLNAIHEEINLSIGNFSLDPLSIAADNRDVTFDIPTIELDNILIDKYTENTSFNLDDIEVTGETDPVSKDFEFDVDDIPVDEITTPAFSSSHSAMLSTTEVNDFLDGKAEDFKLQFDFTAPFDIEEKSQTQVEIKFKYDLPKEIKHFNRVELANSDENRKGSLVEFEVKNPVLLDGLNRSIDFDIDFPANYKLALYDDAHCTLVNDHEIYVRDLAADGEKTIIRFYLKEINNLNDDKFYSADGRTLQMEDEATCTINYKVSGSKTLPKGISVADIKEGLTYSVSLDVAFDVKEAYGDTNPIEREFENEEFEIPVSIKDLDYISYIDKVVLDPEVSQLHFITGIDNDFDKFDLASNCKIVVSFPDEYVFTDNVTLPEGVKRVAGTNDFEVSTMSVFSNAEWVLPIREVRIQSEVPNGTLDFKTKAIVKAVSGTKEEVLTIGAVDNIALKETVGALCDKRNIKLSVSPVEMSVTDATGRTNEIDVPFKMQDFELKFKVEGLEHVSAVDYVEFDSSQKIYFSSSSSKGFGDLNFADGSYVALRFPEDFVFDYDNCTLPYDSKLKAFKIEDLSLLQSKKWALALKRININKEIVDNALDLNATVTLEAVNAKGEEDKLYVVHVGDFSLAEMRKQELFGTHEVQFVVEESTVSVTDLKGKSNNIDVKFDTQKVDYAFAIDSLDYINHIGGIDLKEGSNYLKFHSSLSGELGRFNLAANSYVDFIFPEGFVLDPSSSSIPNGMAQFVDNNTKVRVKDLNALNYENDWKLAVKRINVDKDIIDGKFSADYNIRVVGYSADGVEGNLTIAALDPLYLHEIMELGGKRTMNVSILPSNIEIEDIEASIDDIDFEFEKQSFKIPVNVDKLELVKEINYISFEKGRNVINLNISLNSGLDPFKLTEDCMVKIAFPKNFVLDLAACDFGNLGYDKEENAIYIKQINDIVDCKLKLAIDRIDINQVIENGVFDWTGEISVAAVNTKTGEEGVLSIAGMENLLLSQVLDVIEDKTVTFDVPATDFRIKEAVLVSNMVSADIKKDLAIPLDHTITEPIDRVDSIGFKNPVAMTLKIATKGLETVEAPVNLELDVTLPPVFAISSNDEKVTVTDEGLHIETAHSFKESSDIEFSLLVNSLDFTTLENGYLALPPTENGGRRLKYDADASIVGLVSIDNAQLSSSILNTGVSLDIAFDMDEIVLKDFTGIYGGSIEKITDSFELGIEDGFAELEKNGLTLANTKPELMVSLYNTIGVPVDVDLSIVGRDKEGNAISTSTVVLDDLRIKAASPDAEGKLVADTTRWIFTSNKDAVAPGYEVVVVETLDSLLNELPYSIDFMLDPQIVTKDVVHRVDLSQPLELGGNYSISVPFDLQFAQSIALDLGEEVDFLRKESNNVTLANPQLMVGIHNPIAQDLVFDLSIVGKDEEGKPISSASLVFDEPFVLAAGQRNADGTITPKATRWLFAVSDSITKKGYETKVAPALGTLLNELPHNIDVALNAHFNTDLTTQIDYNNDLELACEYGVLVPLQFSDLNLTYADTVSEIKINLEETLMDMNLSVTNIGLAIAMNLKNTLPIGLKLDLVPLDVDGNVIEEIEIGSVELPAGDGSEIGTGSHVKGTPVELSIKCATSSDLAALDKFAFRLDVASGDNDIPLGGTQGLQISDIVLQIMCDVEMDLKK